MSFLGRPRFSRWIALTLLLGGCSKPWVAIKPNADFRRIRRVAILSLKDYPRAPGSGGIAAGVFEQALLQAGYDLVEREQVDRVLKEQSFSLTGAVDAGSARQIGKILGVDALILGSVTDFTQATSVTRVVGIKEVSQEPIVVRRYYREKVGDVWVTHERDEVQGYRTRRQTVRTPQTIDSAARVGLALRMVDVESGEILWSASYLQEGDNTEEAAETLSRKIMKALKPIWPKNLQP